jgi:hypothetical protein
MNSRQREGNGLTTYIFALEPQKEIPLLLICYIILPKSEV